jgi:hypothetical protein
VGKIMQAEHKFTYQDYRQFSAATDVQFEMDGPVRE